MFCVQVGNSVAFVEAQGLLGYYDVLLKNEVYDGKHTIVVDGETRKGDEYLAYMAFTASFRQSKTYICPVCRAEIERTGEGDASCGHVTFTQPIRPAF